MNQAREPASWHCGSLLSIKCKDKLYKLIENMSSDFGHRERPPTRKSTETGLGSEAVMRRYKRRNFERGLDVASQAVQRLLWPGACRRLSLKNTIRVPMQERLRWLGTIVPTGDLTSSTSPFKLLQALPPSKVRESFSPVFPQQSGVIMVQWHVQ